MSAADKLYERAKRTKAGWRFEEVRRLYLGFGFEEKQGGKHTLFIHPRYPQLVATVTRKRTLAMGYVDKAVRLIEELRRLSEREGSSGGREG